MLISEGVLKKGGKFRIESFNSSGLFLLTIEEDNKVETSSFRLKDIEPHKNKKGMYEIKYNDGNDILIVTEEVFSDIVNAAGKSPLNSAPVPGKVVPR